MGHYITEFLLTLLALFDGHKTVVYVLVALASAVESTPIIGTFTPGVVLLMLFGFVANLEPGDSIFLMIGLATIGAMVGDYVGYLFGRYGRRFFSEHNKILKYSHLESGKMFFAKHGKKSVVFGRFVGPIRPIVPLVAGVVQMPLGQFFLLNFIGALLWSGAYISVGYFFGNHIDLVGRSVSKIGLAGFVLFVAGSSVYVYFKKKSKIIKD